MLPFIIIGCPESTDVDVVIVVNRESECNTCDIKEYAEACRSLGYLGDLDVNYVIVSQERVVWCKHGTPEDTHAIIYYTQSLHANVHLLPLTRPPQPTQEDVKKRKLGLRKFVMDKMKKLLHPNTYTTLRSQKVQLFKTESEEAKDAFMLKVLYAMNDEIVNEINRADTLKTLVMRMLQYFLLTKVLTKDIPIDSRFFTKSGLIFYLEGDVQEEAKYFLYRGKKGGVASLSTTINLLSSVLTL